MPLLVPISDASDPRLSDFTRLTDHETRVADAAPNAGHFIAEGEWTLDRLVESAFPIRSVLVTPQRLELIGATLGRLPESTPVFVAPTELLQSIAGFPFHRGVLVSGGRTPDPLGRNAQRPIHASRLIVALENVSNPDNVGSIFRSLAALVGPRDAGVVVGPGCCHPLYRKAIRVSMGHVFSIPFIHDPDWPASLLGLARSGFDVAALTLTAEARALGTFKPGRPVVLVVGSEGFGLSEPGLASCPWHLVIPMAAGVDSLNVGVATAIAIHHVHAVTTADASPSLPTSSAAEAS